MSNERKTLRGVNHDLVMYDEEYFDHMCWNCGSFIKLETRVICSTCNTAIYCKIKCLKTHEKIHEIGCKTLVDIDKSKKKY